MLPFRILAYIPSTRANDTDERLKREWCEHRQEQTHPVWYYENSHYETANETAEQIVQRRAIWEAFWHSTIGREWSIEGIAKDVEEDLDSTVWDSVRSFFGLPRSRKNADRK